MKKRLMLILVLGLASLANAMTFDVTYNEGTGIVSVDLTADPPTDFIYLVLVVNDQGVLSSSALGTSAPADSVFVANAEDFLSIGQGFIWSMIDSAEPYDYTTGQWLTGSFAFAEGATGNATVSAYQSWESGETAFLDDVEIILIPEPVTIALLGLGGLFLRRRK